MAAYAPGGCIPRGWLFWMGSPGTRAMPRVGSEYLWMMVQHWLQDCERCFLAIPWGRLQRRGRRRRRYRRRPVQLRGWRRGRMGRAVWRRGGWHRGGPLNRVDPELLEELNNQVND